MARRKGSIQKRGPNKYLVRVFLGTDANGKRKYSSKTVNGSWDEANGKLTEMLRELDTNSFVEPSKVTVKEYLEDWLDRKDGIESTTMTDYEDRMKLDVIPYIGSMRLQAVTPETLERLYRELQGMGASNPIPKSRRRLVKEDRDLSSSTVLYTHMILRQALAQAHRRRLISENPADHVENKPKKVRKQHIQPLSEEESNALLAWAAKEQGKYHPLWVVLLTTGARPGEILALQWDCVDLDAGTIHIRRAMTRKKYGKWEPKDYPKNQSSRRTVSLPRITVEALRRLQRAQRIAHMKSGVRSDYVFCNAAGNPWDISRVRKAWKKACQKAEIPVVRLYDARHTHATQLLKKGVNPKIVAERLGHSTIKMTLDTYSHVLPDMQDKAVEAMESLYAAAL
ncbi:MAG TPA: tyrosine-type recombinase/integrase [Longimicrobiales bacterium]